MQFQGGKSRMAKTIAGYINALPAHVYMEPFIGGASVMAEVTIEYRYGSDVDEDLIKMWHAVTRGLWTPPRNVTPEQYKAARNAEPSPYRTFVGYGCSWGGKWFGGYARGEGRNFADEGARRLERIAPRMHDVAFFSRDFLRANFDWTIDQDTVFYCDPPYAGTSGYKTGSFDHGRFWERCNELSEMGAWVLVSERDAPDGWVPLHEWESARSYINNGKGHSRREALFVPERDVELMKMLHERHVALMSA